MARLRLHTVLAAAALLSVGMTDVAPARSCGDRNSVRVGGRVYHSASAGERRNERGRALGRGRLSACGSRARRVRVFAVRGVASASAVIARDHEGRPVLFIRAGHLPELPAHPLHRRLYPRHGPVGPEGCSRRTFELVAVVRQTPAFGDLLILDVVRADPGVALDEDGASAVAAVVPSTLADLRLRGGAPYVKRGTTLVGDVSPCLAGQNVFRVVRSQSLAAPDGAG